MKITCPIKSLSSAMVPTVETQQTLHNLVSLNMLKQADALKVCPIPDAGLLAGTLAGVVGRVMAQRLPQLLIKIINLIFKS
jgi:hypothetical protein